MQARSLAVIAAVALLATLIAPVNLAQVPDPEAGELQLSTSAISVTEPTGASSTATYTVRLSHLPQGAVAVNVALVNAGSDLTVSPHILRFNATDWDRPKTVTLTFQGDNAVEGFEQSTVTNAVADVPENAPNYQGKSATVTVKVTDNDFGIAVVHSGGSTEVKEANVAGRTDSFTIALGTAPTGTVTITFSPPAQLFPSVGSASFTPSNWRTPKTVSVSAAMDNIDQDFGTLPIGFSVASTAPSDPYAGQTGSIPVTIVEDDVAGFNFGPAGVNVLPTAAALQVSEGSASTKTYAIRLTSQPLSNVVLALTADSQVTVAPASITFTPTNWATAVVVTVGSAEDQVDEASPHAGAISQAASSSDPKYSAMPTGTASVPVNVVDNDVAALVIAQSGLGTSVTEGAATGDSFTVGLATRPAAAVTVTLTAAAAGQIVATPSTLTFAAGADPATSAQTVTVTAVDDEAPELTKLVVLTADATGSDPFYGGTAVANAVVTVQVLDDDGVGIIDLGDGLVVAENGATDTYTLRLAEEPDSPTVVVNLEASTPEFSVSPATITFHKAQQPPQPEEFCLLDTSDPACLPCVVPEEVAEIIETTAEPVAPTLNLCTDEVPDLPLWNEAYTVTVTAVNDEDLEGLDLAGLVKHTVSAPTGSNYAGTTITDVPVAVIDDEKAVFVKPTGTGTTVSEDGLTVDTYTVELSSPPSFIVYIAFDGGDSLTDMPTLAFDENDWNTPKTVTVAAVQDNIDQGDSHAAAIAHTVASAEESGYDGIAVPDLAVTITDDDVAGLVVLQSEGTTAVTEGSTGDWYQVRLATKPSEAVIVSFANPDGQLVLGQASLTFTPADWNTLQLAWVTALNDAVVEGAHTGSVAFTLGSDDDLYDGLVPPALAVAITDND